MAAFVGYAGYLAAMRILVAPDSFKGSLTSVEATVAMVSGIRAVIPDADIIPMPLADGGEGTLEVLQSVYCGQVYDDVLYVDGNAGQFALIESARFIGLTLPCMQSDVFERGSARLGRAVLSAMDAGVNDIRIALGGSATLDGGLGFLTTFGCRILDKDGTPVSADLKGLMRAEQIDVDELDQRISKTNITVLSDVQSSLCGNHGSVYSYGPQKGIQNSRLPDVETAMQHWAGVCEQAFGVSVINDAGAGAAGGLGFALRLLGAQIVSGAEYVMQACGFAQVIETVDWVVTGEGRSDVQTLDGKLPMGVAQAARKAGISVALISGDMVGRQKLSGYFDVIVSIREEGISEAESMARAKTYLRAAAERWAHRL